MSDKRAPNPFVLPKDSPISTFFYDETLPSLPLPDLEKTLDKYFESVKPFVTPEELENTRKIIDDFKNGIGQQLQMKLAEKAASSRNWLEQWWFDLAYLKSRFPMVPFTSFTGLLPKNHGGWPSEGPKDQINNCSYYLYLMTQFWQNLIQERLPPAVTSDKKIFDMSQFRRLFNAARLPGRDIDSLTSYFKTAKEGDCPSHLVIIHKGHYFKMDVKDKNGELLTPPAIANILSSIMSSCNEEPLPNVATLTCTNRTTWWKNREKFMKISEINEKFLEILGSAIAHVVLETGLPESDDEGSYLNFSCDRGDRWTDKSFLVIVYKNGRTGGISEHTQYDGMTTFTLNMFFLTFAEMCYKRWKDEMPTESPGGVENSELIFDLNDDLENEIKLATLESKNFAQMVTHNFRTFTGYGKAAITKENLHPDTYLQMSLQLAYMKLHAKPAPVYETATTRQFYHGRTETLRSCTTECLQWVKAMLDPNAKVSEKYEKLVEAVEKHNQLMKEGCNNEGCDRHLLGLQCIAEEEGIPLPALYTDPSYIKSGGGCNFILSTSLAGYSAMSAVVAPMTTDGYGTFYAPVADQIVFGISTFKESKETNAEEFFRCLQDSLNEMMEVVVKHKAGGDA